MNEILLDSIPEMIGTLVGIFVGSISALAFDRWQERRRNQRRRRITLSNLMDELQDNYRGLKAVVDSYRETPYGKSVYISTIAWDTAISSGDLTDLIGAELADYIENQYAALSRLRYYIGLQTKLWFAPRDIEGYEQIREGFRRKILDGIEVILHEHTDVTARIRDQLDPDRKE